MRFATTLVLALLLLTLESVVVKYLGLSVSRIDVTVVLIAFLGLGASPLEGAASAFAVGYLLDMTSGHPTGLYTFLAVFTFLMCRLAGSMVDVRSVIAFGLFTMAADLGHGLLAVFFLWLTSRDASFGSVLSGLLLQVALTGVAAVVLYPLLRKFDRRSDRAEAGILR